MREEADTRSPRSEAPNPADEALIRPGPLSAGEPMGEALVPPPILPHP